MKNLIMLIFIILFIIQCENVNDYQKKEDLRNLYIFLQLPTEEKLLQVCIQSENQALQCANTNQTLYINLLNSYYQILITTNNPVNYCPDIINSPTFIKGNFSIDAKRCHFECNLNFWNSITNCSDFNSILTEYSNCLPGIWISNCKNTIFKKCLENCFLYGDPIWFIPNE